MKIICVGRNYAEHARELNNEVPTAPVLFMKPETALIPKGHPFFYPEHTSDLHYEVELVLKVSRLGKHIDLKYAHKYYSEVGIGIDFTARDVQQKCKENGMPWEIAKAWDQSAPLSQKFIPLSTLPNPKAIQFTLKKNGEVVQHGNSADMLFDFDALIVHISKYFTLKMGDLIYTGTPKGVGPVKQGDQLEAYLEGQKMLSLQIK
jgi:2-keto-4-pentenoate hydratase/2-oxohepta-3-ene-1,7-dioic acid hydratase in catechol pathway